MQIIDLNNITIGSDPEFFIVDNNNKAYPSIDIISGTKEEPEDKGNGYAVLKDNVLIEGNIPPCKTQEEYIIAFKTLKQLMNDILSLKGLKLHSADSMPYSPKYLRHPEACIFGCSSYKNGWLIGDFSAENMNHLPIRVAGLHQHIGYQLLTDKYNQKQINRYIARAFDYFVTFPARQHFNDEFRERYYGNYGVYRNTSYGLECRALGGYFGDDKYLPWIYNQLIKTMTFCSNSDNLVLLDLVRAPVTKELTETLKEYKVLNIDLQEQLIKI